MSPGPTTAELAQQHADKVVQEFRERLAVAIKESGKSHRAIAREAGISNGTLAAILSTSSPSLETMAKLEFVLGRVMHHERILDVENSH